MPVKQPVLPSSLLNFACIDAGFVPRRVPDSLSASALLYQVFATGAPAKFEWTVVAPVEPRTAEFAPQSSF